MLSDLIDLLKTCIGLDAASIGMAAIERAVEQRRSASGLPDLAAYCRRVQSSDQELQQLIEAVVVSETWFFRHDDTFPLFLAQMRDSWLRNSAGTLQLLSLPCSTGEEPYSMAMALLDGGMPPERFRIDAIDISERALALAREGIYGRNSFRGSDLGFRERYFEALPRAWRISETIRRQVQFRHDNLFARDFLPGGERYDAIFCRNVLIYFDRETQDRAMGVLKRLLKSRGTLFVAPAESGLPTAHGFATLNATAAFAFQRGERRAAAHRPAPVIVRQAAPPPAPASAPVPTARPATTAAPIAPVPPPAAADPADALRLADQGHFAEAASCCEAWLRAHGPSAEAFYVLGLVRDATGNQPDAESYYRKALYLDPQHEQALVQLALLIETRGDHARAHVLRRRARRLDPEQVRPRG